MVSKMCKLSKAFLIATWARCFLSYVV